MRNYRDSVAAYMKNGTLHYLAKEGTTSNIENAMCFDNWEQACDAIFSGEYNKRDISGWFVFTQYDGKWRLRNHVCHDDWLSKFYEERNGQ